MNLTTGDYIRAIKAKCRSCSGGSLSAAKACGIRECDLWPMTDWHRERTPMTVKRAQGEQLTIKVNVHVEEEGKA